jgi:HD-like signal output (HDOD) protein/prolyl-tRNA editing enzyme YbaK/EbsC (Cys-tRNA(Pro) deacylase)
VILAIVETVKTKLDDLGVSYQVVSLNEPMDLVKSAQFLADNSANLIRCVALKSGSKYFVAILPYNAVFDYKVFSEHFAADYDVISGSEKADLFKGCDSNSLALVPELYKFRLIVDTSVLDLTELYMQSGDLKQLIKIDKINANLLFQECESATFAISEKQFYAGQTPQNHDSELDVSFTQKRIKQRIDETFDLPAMPEIAQDIMKLRVDPSADAVKLAQIVCRDPSLATQVISWASSPYYGYQGKIDSVETAIARVLGFELVMNLALGISIGKSLKAPMEGPLGVREFWKQAIYSANLAEKICRAMPIKQRPERGLIYLSGLLHNFGHLLLGHLFLPQFKLINAAVSANPYTAVEDIECYILGVNHQEIGAWLMKNWHMPDELIVAVHRHHQEEFWSKHSVYSNIVLISNRLLKRLDIGDAINTEIPQTTLELLSLEEGLLEGALKDIQAESETLDIMAKQLVA